MRDLGVPFSEIDDYLGGTMRIEDQLGFDDDEHYIESLSDEEYAAFEADLIAEATSRPDQQSTQEAA